MTDQTQAPELTEAEQYEADECESAACYEQESRAGVTR